MSQAKLAKRIDMSRTSIVNIEAGRQHPSLHVLWAIAEELGTDVALLVPSHSDYDDVGPVELDSKSISLIETAANGDHGARRDLLAFISYARKKAKELV